LEGGNVEINQISNAIIGAAIEVHRVLGGPGLLEDVYVEALCRELRLRGFEVKRQVRIPVLYKGIEVKNPLILDVLVNDEVIVEVKAVEKDNPVYQAQLLTYLRLTGKKLGLVINFGESRVADGIHRVVNGI
jgi:GxxExxY protein